MNPVEILVAFFYFSKMKYLCISLVLLFVIYPAISQEIQLFGHRGAKGHAPENTLISVKKALAFDVDGVEGVVMALITLQLLKINQ